MASRLALGATLIGEAVDYAIYLFTQTAPNSPVRRTMERIWPTLRLGVLTSVCGFSVMLLSSFEGFAQLGLFTIVGLVVAACVTRWVLPAMLPAGFTGVQQSRTMMRIATLGTHGRRLRPGIVVLALAAAISLALGQGPFWAGDLSSLSPVPPAEQQLDQSLRHDMRAPEATTLIVIRKPDQNAALEAAERITRALAPMLRRGGLAGIDSPARYLPSAAVQRERQSALPVGATLQAELDAALDGLPFQSGLFGPFVADVDRERSMALINRGDLDEGALSLKLDSLLLRQGDGWTATLSLRGVTAPAAMAQAIVGEPDAILVNLRTESDRLLQVYLREGVSLASFGAAAIGLLLLVSLAFPAAASSGHRAACGGRCGHVRGAPAGWPCPVDLQPVWRAAGGCDRVQLLPFLSTGSTPIRLARRGYWYRLLLANGCTVMGFGVLALSHTPVLHDMGMPVAVGTFLSLLFAAIFMSPPQEPEQASVLSR